MVDLVADPGALLQMKDESGRDPELARFIATLREVVAAKDATRLLAMTLDTVRISFGEDNGKPAFIKQWKLDKNPQESPIWAELTDVLALGGAFGEPAPGQQAPRLYFAPYIFLHFPAGYDNFQYLAVTGRDVKVQSSPAMGASVVETVSYTVVKWLGDDPANRTATVDGRSYRWAQVETLAGHQGYVLKKFVRSPVDYRLGVGKQTTGAWSIELFVAGD
ncbi:MAG: hypothetical protein ACYC5Y_02870 [Symbiobacteriia bacterium]